MTTDCCDEGLVYKSKNCETFAQSRVDNYCSAHAIEIAAPIRGTSRLCSLITETPSGFGICVGSLKSLWDKCLLGR